MPDDPVTDRLKSQLSTIASCGVPIVTGANVGIVNAPVIVLHSPLAPFATTVGCCAVAPLS